MTNGQRLQVRASQIRQKLNELAGADELTDEQRSEIDTLTTEFADVETRMRAAIVAEGAEGAQHEDRFKAEDAEVRERREIRQKTGLKDYLIAACSGAPVQGAAAEFNAACGVAAGDHVPRELFDGPAREMRQAQIAAEHRAVTPGPEIDAAPRPTIPYLFAQAVITSLSTEYPSVESGQQQIPSITTAPPASVLAKDAAAPATAAAYALVSRSPKRLSGQIDFRVEDLAVHPALEADLTASLQGSLSNQLDEEGFNGTGGSDNLNGLFNQATDVAATGVTDTFSLALAAVAAQVDGRFSRGLGDLRGVIGPATFAHYMSLFKDSDTSLFEKLRSLMGSLVVSDRMPAVASGAQKGLVSRNAGAQPIRIYTWGSLQMIRDPFSKGGQGAVTVTAIQLVSDPFVPHGTSQVVEINRDLS